MYLAVKRQKEQKKKLYNFSLILTVISICDKKHIQKCRVQKKRKTDAFR